jgi:iron complex transport system ATP-binding protein
VLHDVDLAREFGDHLLLLRRGRLLASGPPAETLTTEMLAQLYDCEPQWLAAGGSEP